MENKYKITLRVLFWGLTLALMVIIFAHSAQVAEVSSATSASFTAKVLSVVYPSFNDFEAARQESIISSLQHLVRKSAHFTVYLALGVTSFSALCTYDLKRKTKAISALSLCVPYAVSDELHQLFVPGRAGRIGDVLLDSCGAVCGILLVMGVIALYKKKHNGGLV